MSELPPGPYHECGDCNCGEKEKRGSDPPRDERED
jgi:hypothetical protein